MVDTRYKITDGETKRWQHCVYYRRIYCINLGVKATIFWHRKHRVLSNGKSSQSELTTMIKCFWDLPAEDNDLDGLRQENKCFDNLQEGSAGWQYQSCGSAREAGSA